MEKQILPDKKTLTEFRSTVFLEIPPPKGDVVIWVISFLFIHDSNIAVENNSSELYFLNIFIFNL